VPSSAGARANRNASPPTSVAANAAPAAEDRSVDSLATAAPAADAASLGQLSANQRSTNSMYLRNRSLNAAAPLNGPVALSIEHNRETTGGSSEVTGSVIDPTGAVIPGATITWRQVGGASAGNTTTASDGRFTIPALPAGSYTLQIASPGFEQLSQRLDLLPRDLATLRSTLQPGAVTTTVDVSSANAEMATIADSVESKLAPGSLYSLPSQQQAIMTLQSRKRLLAVDAAGTLFLSRNAGKRWKTIKPQWPGKIAHLSLAPSSASETGQPVFQLTTDQGAVSLSDDGAHWHLR